MVRTRYEKQHPIKKGRRFLLLLLFIAIFMVPIYMLIHNWLQKSSSFTIKSIKIKGNQSIPDADILMATGIKEHTNLFSFDKDSCKLNIEKNPQIFSAQIAKKFPNQLSIQVTEREPIAIVNGASLYFIDKNAMIWEKNEHQINDLPFISGIPQDSIIVGATLNIQKIDKIIRLIEITETRSLISEIIVQNTQNITFFTLNEGFRVYLGQDEFEKKITHLNKILPEIRNKDKVIDYIDLRFHNEAIVKLARN